MSFMVRAYDVALVSIDLDGLVIDKEDLKKTIIGYGADVMVSKDYDVNLNQVHYQGRDVVLSKDGRAEDRG